jgi:hypothetical protein
LDTDAELKIATGRLKSISLSPAAAINLRTMLFPDMLEETFGGWVL